MPRVHENVSTLAFLFAFSLAAGEMLTITPEPGGPYARKDAIVVELPEKTPHAKGSVEEKMYYEGFALGFMDAKNSRYKCRSRTGNRVKYPSWDEGWEAGFNAARPTNDSDTAKEPPKP
jgi:hypothetical protein